MAKANPKCLIVGAGPAALMAAHKMATAGITVEVFEKRPGPGRKFLIAGSSGLNISFEEKEEDFSSFYRSRREELKNCFQQFGKKEWLAFVESLGSKIFLGTSRRYFVEEMKASPLLRAWMNSLDKLGVLFHYKKEFLDFSKNEKGFKLHFADGSEAEGDALLFALGGGSYEKAIPVWIEIFRQKQFKVHDLKAANAGYHLDAPTEFFTTAEGKPLKGITLRTALGEKTGELMLTRYGLEGTPVYTLGTPGPAMLDLKPDLGEAKLASRLSGAKGSAWQKVEHGAKLSEGALLLAKFLAPQNAWISVEQAARTLKNFPITLLHSRPMEEAISTSGGISWDELDAHLQSKKNPGIFFAGEMVDWDAPTGGFLLTACVSMGVVAANGVQQFLKK